MSENTYIDLLRHGDTDGGNCFRGITDDPLSELGWSQMRASIEQVEPRWDCIISSPLKRCMYFSNEIGKRFSIPVICDERFQEMHFGAWEGCTAGEIMETDADGLKNFWNDPINNTPPQAEPLADFEIRVVAAWREVLSFYAGERILLVSHGGVIRVLLCLIQRHPIKRLLELEVGYASIKHIRIEHSDGHNYVIESTNTR